MASFMGGYGYAQTVSLARPPTRPCWSFMLPTVALAGLAVSQRRKSLGKRRQLYASILLRATLAFAAELACCLIAWAWHGLRRRRDRRPHVALYCGFGFIPGERRAWDGASLRNGIGGSEQCAIRLSRALAAAGRDVVVYGGSRKPVTIDGVAYEPARRFDPWAAYEAVVVWRVPQVLLVQRWAAALLGAQSWRAKRVAYWIHDGAYLEILRRAGPRFRAAIRGAVRGADAVVFPSAEMRAAQHAALFPPGDAHDGGADVLAKARVLRHGVPRYFDAAAAGSRRDGWLLWPVSVERGLDDLLAVVPRLRRAVEARGGDFKLFVCHHEAGYHGRGASRKLPDDVVFAGMLPPARLATMLRACSLFVFPSAVPEAFSISAWECAAHGVVPVVYGLGALEALGRVGCPVVAPGDLDGLADAAAALLGDPRRAAALRES
eukprot:CAMPEP_0119263030 /NCGR_PEP_ID=MMETSP1329-20130426/2567_1 /TAXON_ID=114041 /ORGANISM="Genus nov. species nov., Strain RCC1024" /LENGTH=434 /DNA_ID=CAMNT_0007262725 /DNA_START=90 /DNA_END=1391 /DNA_ORIENTATION=+